MKLEKLVQNIGTVFGLSFIGSCGTGTYNLFQENNETAFGFYLGSLVAGGVYAFIRSIPQWETTGEIHRRNATANEINELFNEWESMQILREGRYGFNSVDYHLRLERIEKSLSYVTNQRFIYKNHDYRERYKKLKNNEM